MDHIRTGGTLLNQKFTPALMVAGYSDYFVDLTKEL